MSRTRRRVWRTFFQIRRTQCCISRPVTIEFNKCTKLLGIALKNKKVDILYVGYQLFIFFTEICIFYNIINEN